MSIFEVALNLRAAGADFSGALDQLKLNAGFLESELGKHKWSAYCLPNRHSI